MIDITLGSLDETIIDHLCPIEIESLGQVLDTTVVGGIADLGCRGTVVFEIDGVFSTYDFLSVLIHISARQLSRFSVLVIEFESPVELQVVIGVAPSAQAVTVPEQTEVEVGHDEGDTYLCIILIEFLVFAQHIVFLSLVLSESIYSLQRLFGLELQVPSQSVQFLFRELPLRHAQFSLWNAERLELLSVFLLLDQFFALSIEEGHVSRRLVHDGLHASGLHIDSLAVLVDLEFGFGGLRNDDQAFFLGKRLLHGSPDPDDVVIDDFQANHPCAVFLGFLHLNGHAVAILDKIRRHGGLQSCEEECCN